MFAETTDVQARLGRDLTTAETALATALLEGATALVVDAVGQTSTWADALDPVPTLLKIVTVEAVHRVMVNPTGATSFSQQLGTSQFGASYRGDTGGLGLLLTDAEARLARSAVYGRNSGSARIGSTLSDTSCEETTL